MSDSERHGCRPHRQTERIEVRSRDPALIVEHDFDNQTSELTVTVVDAVSQVAGITPTEIVPRVTDSLDPDGLDRLFQPGPDGQPRSGRLVFELLEYTVEVHGDGTVAVYDV